MPACHGSRRQEVLLTSAASSLQQEDGSACVQRGQELHSLTLGPGPAAELAAEPSLVTAQLPQRSPWLCLVLGRVWLHPTPTAL